MSSLVQASHRLFLEGLQRLRRCQPRAVWLVFLSFPAWAQVAPGPEGESDAGGLTLRPSGLLTDRLPEEARKQLPSFLSGDQIQGTTNQVTEVEGSAELRRHDTVLRADRMQLNHETQDAQAQGSVVVIRNGNRFMGPELQLNLDTYEGFFLQPRYQLLEGGGGGQADRADFKGENLTVVHNATYTTCLVPPGAQPDWWIQANHLELDTAEEVGRATSGALLFKGVPVLAAPYISFPLSKKRKSGLLPPTINLTNLSGLEVATPYYWNIAPNLDATITPTFMTKRGVDFGTEFRYLMPSYRGETHLSWMPSDRLRSNQQRWGYSLQHDHAWPSVAALGMANAGLKMNLNRVSDDNYWRDFPRGSGISSLTQRLLPGDVSASAWWGGVAVTAGVYTWQTLQDASAPITAPYDRQPQFDARWERFNQTWGGVDGLDVSVSGQYTRFVTPRVASVTATQADINGNRSLGILQISRPWKTPGWFFKPKLQVHATHYGFDQPLYNGRMSVSRVLPTLSMDGGWVLERDTRLMGRDLVQTLEPRAFYVKTPYRDQRFLPVYDSGAKDFNAGTAWTENDFGGNDRIADAHTLTLGVGSRLIESTSGAELARVSVAQRYRFSDQLVTLPGGVAQTQRRSDWLLGGALSWVPAWALEGSVQFNPQTQRSQRTTLNLRYNPKPYHVVSAAYRMQRAGGPLPPSELVDLGWQWPLTTQGRGKGQGGCSGDWYGVGRVNYSLPDRKVVDLVAGIEYDSGCWVGRVVLDRLQRGAANSSQRILFQLEFTGFTRIGSNPLQTLKDNIPKYMQLNERVQTPSRFGTYE